MGQLVNYKGTIIDVDQQLEDLDREDCQDSLYTFLQYAWRYIDPAPFAPGWVVEAVAEHLEAVCDGDIKRLLINIPPRCSKSSICSVAFPAWVWAQESKSGTSGPTVPFLHASYGFGLSRRDSIKCRRLIESPWYQKLWGHRFHLVGDQNTILRFGNDKGGERLITAIGAGVTGEGGNIIIVDDPNAANEVLSEATIKSTNEDWWDGTMSTRLNDAKTGAFIVVQQRLGEEDLTGHILERESKDWVHLMLPMEYEPGRSFSTLIGWEDPRTEEGQLLWPARFGKGEVHKLAQSLGKWKAAGQLQQRPEPAGGGIIKREWWQLWPKGGELVDANGKPVRPLEFPPCEFVLASLDTAYTEETMNDPSALTIWGVFSNAEATAEANRFTDHEGKSVEYKARSYDEQPPCVMMLYAWSDRLELHNLVLKVNSLCRKYKVDKLLIENKASGISVAQELRRLFSRENYAVQLSNPGRVDKMARLYSVQHLFEEGMVYAPDRTWAETVIAQVGTFPNARHDDLVDTTSQGLRHLRDIGLLTRAPELEAELEDRSTFSGRPPAPLYPV